MKLTRDLLERLVKGFQYQHDGKSSNVWVYNPSSGDDSGLLSNREEWIAHNLLVEFGWAGCRKSIHPSQEHLRLALNFCKAMLKDEKIQ